MGNKVPGYGNTIVPYKIFVLDKNPIICASYFMDVHIDSSIQQLSQMMCDAHHVTGTSIVEIPLKPLEVISNRKHINVSWVRENLYNYFWVSNLAEALISEYQFRFNINHDYYNIVSWCQDNAPDIPPSNSIIFNSVDLHGSKLVYTIEKGVSPDYSVIKWREYYSKAFNCFATWTRRNKPYWFNGKKEQILQDQIKSIRHYWFNHRYKIMY